MYTTVVSPQQGGPDLLGRADAGARGKLHAPPDGRRNGTVPATRQLDEKAFKLAALSLADATWT